MEPRLCSVWRARIPTQIRKESHRGAGIIRRDKERSPLVVYCGRRMLSWAWFGPSHCSVQSDANFATQRTIDEDSQVTNSFQCLRLLARMDGRPLRDRQASCRGRYLHTKNNSMKALGRREIASEIDRRGDPSAAGRLASGERDSGALMDASEPFSPLARCAHPSGAPFAERELGSAIVRTFTQSTIRRRIRIIRTTASTS